MLGIPFQKYANVANMPRIMPTEPPNFDNPLKRVLYVPTFGSIAERGPEVAQRTDSVAELCHRVFGSNSTGHGTMEANAVLLFGVSAIASL